MKLRPLTRLCVTIGEIPSSYLISMTYEEQLLWLCHYLQNTIIPVINDNSEALKETQKLVEDLKAYVDNYFDEINIQEEIDNKLNEMFEDGTLENLISQYIELKTTYVYDNVEEMKNSTNLTNGSFARTSGFYNYNDNGGAYYKVREKLEEDIIDNIILIEITNSNLLCELIPPQIIKPEIFGAIGDGVHNDTQSFNKMINYVNNLRNTSDWEKNKPMICENIYYIDEIIIPNGMQLFNMIGNKIGTFKYGGFTFKSGTGWKTQFKELLFIDCLNPINFEYYNVEYGNINIEECTFNRCSGITLNIERRSHQVFINKNRFSNCEKICYLHDVDLCYFEKNWIESSLTWNNNHYDIEQFAEFEGTLFIKENIFVRGTNDTGTNCAWIKIGRNANIENNRFSGEYDGVHPIYVDYDEFDTFDPNDNFMYPIINFTNNPIVASNGSLLLNKYCGQLNIHNNSFVKSHPCIEVINDSIFNNLDFNKLYISIRDNGGKIFNYRNNGYSLIDGKPIIPKCLQKFIKYDTIFAKNTNLNYEVTTAPKKLIFKLNSKNLNECSDKQFIFKGKFFYNPSMSGLMFDNFIGILSIKREYNSEVGGLIIKPVVKIIESDNYETGNITLTPKINGQNYLISADNILSENIELEVEYTGAVDSAYIQFKGFAPLELIPTVNTTDENDWLTNN